MVYLFHPDGRILQFDAWPHPDNYPKWIGYGYDTYQFLLPGHIHIWMVSNPVRFARSSLMTTEYLWEPTPKNLDISEYEMKLLLIQ